MVDLTSLFVAVAGYAYQAASSSFKMLDSPVSRAVEGLQAFKGLLFRL